MATTKKKQTEQKKTAHTPSLAPVPVTVVGYQFSDEAIDETIDLAFRIFERMASRPDVIARVAQLVLLANRLQP